MSSAAGAATSGPKATSVAHMTSYQPPRGYHVSQLRAAPTSHPPALGPMSEHAMRDIERKARDESRELRRAEELKHKKEDMKGAAKTEWTEKVLPHWSALRSSNHVRRLCQQGIPPAVRGQVWLRMLGNGQQITEEHFGECLASARACRDILTQQQDQLGRTDASASAQTQPQLPDEVNRGIKCLQVIDVDLPRTFAQYAFFHGESPLGMDLRNMLEAYAFHRPDVGYVQGMSYLACIILLYVDGYSAFVCFANLIERHMFLDLFRLERKSIDLYLQTYDEMLHDHCPLVHRHFRRCNVSHEVYMIDWLLTLYTRCLPLDLAARVWDIFMVDGDLSLFRVAIGLMRLYRDEILRMDMEGLLRFLTHIPDDVQEDRLFDCILSTDIPQNHFRSLLRKNSPVGGQKTLKR